MDTISNEKLGYEVKVIDGETHFYCMGKDNKLKDYTLTPGETTRINYKGQSIDIDMPSSFTNDTSILLVGNGNGDYNYKGLSALENDDSRLYVYHTAKQTSSSAYNNMSEIVKSIAEANNVDNPSISTSGFSGSGPNAYQAANNNPDIVTCIEADPVSSTGSYSSNGSTYTLIFGSNGKGGDLDSRLLNVKKGERNYEGAKNVLAIELGLNREKYHGKYIELMGKYNLTDFVDGHVDINEVLTEIKKDYPKHSLKLTLIDKDGNIIENCSPERAQEFLDEAYDAVLTSKSSNVKSPKTGDIYSQEIELEKNLSNINLLVTNDSYSKGAISTKYQSVVDGINGISSILSYTNVYTKNPGLAGNKNLNNQVSGFLGCMAYASNNILLDTKNITESFGKLLQNYSYLEESLNKSVADINELDYSGLFNDGNNANYDNNISMLLNFDGYKSTYESISNIKKLRVGGVSSSELSTLLSNNGAIKSFFDNEISNSRDLIKNIDILLSSETQGPGWEEAKKVLKSVQSNVQIRLKTSEYAESKMIQIFGKLKTYIDSNAGSDGYITDANLDYLRSQANNLSRIIADLAARISAMPDILWYQENGEPVGNFEKAMLSQELHQKEALLAEINAQINIIEGYRALVQECMSEMSGLLEETYTSSYYYGGLIDIPNIDASKLGYLNN